MMRSVPRNAASAFVSLVRRARERRRLSRLYTPDPSNLNAAEHIAGALAWLERAQDAGTDRGVSYGVRFGSDFQESYPETTGYICRTFVEHAQAGGDPRLMHRAIEMGHWESDIQLPDGSVMSGKVTRDPRPAIFNTGMAMLGWNSLIRSRGDDRARHSCERAARWLVSMQETDGHWLRGNSAFARPGSTLYNVKAAWALCEAGQLLERPQYVEAAVRNAEFCLSRQRPNGWFEDCCLSDPERPLLHTLAYAMQGLIGIGRLTGRREFIAAARKTADAQLNIMGADGFIAGRQDASFAPCVRWCCLTGSAQTSSVWGELFLLTGEEKYRDAMHTINCYLMARHDIGNPDPRLRGGVPGSWPTWGEYGRLMVLNWATKFLVDALTVEERIRGANGPLYGASISPVS